MKSQGMRVVLGGRVAEEGGVSSGRHSVQKVGASVVKKSDKGKAQGKPMLLVEARPKHAGRSLRQWL